MNDMVAAERLQKNPRRFELQNRNLQFVHSSAPGAVEDFLTLTNGQILTIDETKIVLYDDMQKYEDGDVMALTILRVERPIARPKVVDTEQGAAGQYRDLVRNDARGELIIKPK